MIVNKDGMFVKAMQTDILEENDTDEKRLSKFKRI